MAILRRAQRRIMLLINSIVIQSLPGYKRERESITSRSANLFYWIFPGYSTRGYSTSTSNQSDSSIVHASNPVQVNTRWSVSFRSTSISCSLLFFKAYASLSWCCLPLPLLWLWAPRKWLPLVSLVSVSMHQRIESRNDCHPRCGLCEYQLGLRRNYHLTIDILLS